MQISLKKHIPFLTTFLIAICTSSIASAENASRFGGESYRGAPVLTVTAALIKAGGGTNNFNFARALVSMLGEKTVNGEVEKLTRQYGKEEVTTFLAGMTFAVNSAIKHVTKAGISLPPAPRDLHGAALAKVLVDAGTATDNSWWSGLLFDKALSNQIHLRVMADIDAEFGQTADKTTHKILNQAMYDVAQALGKKNVKLAWLH